MNFIVSQLLQLVLLIFFNTYVLNLSWSKKQLIVILIVGVLPMPILFSYMGAISILYFIAMLSIFIYIKTLKKMVVFHVFMSLILLVISDNISGVLLFRYFKQEMNVTDIPVMYIVLLLGFGTIAAFLYKKLIEKVLNRFIVNDALIYVFSFFCIGIVIFIYMNIIAIDSNQFYENVKSNLVLFLLFFLLLIVSLFIALFLAFQRYKIKKREEELNDFATYIASIEQINRDMRKFKHDHVNMLTSLKTFIDDKNFEELHTYYYEYILEMNTHEQLNEQALMMLNNLKIDSLKGLFTTKIIQAQTKKTPFYVEVVEEITDIPVDPIKLNRVVGILLDNAVEAASEAENKEVRVALIRMEESILLVVNNTYDTMKNLKVHELYQEGFSTKGENRGLGLATLQQIKNQSRNINLRTRIDLPYFTQEVEFIKREGKL